MFSYNGKEWFDFLKQYNLKMKIFKAQKEMKRES
jgi:hypothetical protein